MMKSSTGGSITTTRTGLIHKASEGAYSGRVAELGIECKVVDAPKRGRGRPKKVSQTGTAYDFSAFLSNVKVPKWNGPVRVYAKKDAE
jgi:hypothetical protein